jgi:hypothetical protein
MAYTRDDIVKAGRSYIGTPFKFRGRSRLGIDCVGLLYCIGQDIGFPIEDDQTYSKFPEPDKFRNIIYAHSKPGDANNLRNGTVAMFKQSIYPLHCGVLVVDNTGIKVINANMKSRKVVEENWAVWRSLLLDLREFPGV